MLGGGDNSRKQDRKDYFQQEKEYKRSIIINVQVLTEGYDDPTVNTVVMATPSKSKLYYMQAIGRAIRCDPSNSLKNAYVVEIVDELPNVRYRIDNRWLYSDISDALEPIVDDRSFTSEDNLMEVLKDIYLEFRVPREFHIFPKYDSENRYSLLLFNIYYGESDYKFLPLLIDNNNRTSVSNVYNFISERLAYSGYGRKGINYQEIFNMVSGSIDLTGIDDKKKKLLYDAMENASKFVNDEKDIPEWIKKGRPWIGYVSFTLRERNDLLPGEIIEFMQDMINKKSILESLLEKNYEKGNILIKLPLPLKKFVGKIVTKSELVRIDQIVTDIITLKEVNDEDHRSEVDEIIGKSSLPLELREANSLVIIARENLRYTIEL